LVAKSERRALLFFPLKQLGNINVDYANENSLLAEKKDQNFAAPYIYSGQWNTVTTM
jgi:hypothetical protein